VTTLQTTITYAGLVVVSLVLAGLIRRGTARTARAFSFYLAWMLAASVPAILWPARFYTWDFWVFRQISLDALELAILVELAYWIFLGFPGAALSARTVVLAFLVATFCAVMAPVHADVSGPLMGALRARVEIGTAWGFAAISGLTLYYDIPVRRIHRAIMLGLVIKLVLLGEILQFLAERGPRFEPIFRTIQPAAFVGIACWWAVEAWRREPAPTVDPELAAQLQPWRAR